MNGIKTVKILISYRGAPRIRGWETGVLIADAFRDLGHEVDEYGNVYETMKGEWVSELRPDTILQKEYDLCIWMEKNDPERQYLELAAVKAAYKVAWFFDLQNYPDFCRKLADHMQFNHVFCANPNYLKLFKVASFLPYGASSKFFRPLTWPKQYDVGLVGSDRPERQALISALKADGINAHLISGVFKDAYIDALASCKVVINDIAGGGIGLLSMRAYEAPAAGALTIFEDAEALGDQLIPGIDCLTYSHSKELITKCSFLLKDTTYLEQVRACGQKRVLEHHTYVARANEILNVIGY